MASKKNSSAPSNYDPNYGSSGKNTQSVPAYQLGTDNWTNANRGQGLGYQMGQSGAGGKNVSAPDLTNTVNTLQAQQAAMAAPQQTLDPIGMVGDEMSALQAGGGTNEQVNALRAAHPWQPTGTPWGKVMAGNQYRSDPMMAAARNVGGYDRTVANHLANALRQQNLVNDPNRLAPTGQGWQDYNQEQGLLQAQQTNPNALMFDPYNPLSYNNPNSLVWNGATGQYEPMSMNPTSRDNMGI